jgi:hypothetical protein
MWHIYHPPATGYHSPLGSGLKVTFNPNAIISPNPNVVRAQNNNNDSKKDKCFKIDFTESVKEDSCYLCDCGAIKTILVIIRWMVA